ncbi:MAG: glycine zipper 2TM domain-containing protein [Gammaproteobacteria bacterium]|nr:glycine zipper 2TM domain-containing protein [Gammaproteobacteria bacterium]
MNRSILTAISISLLTLGLTGCVSGLQGSTYSRSEARQVQEVEFGTVLSTNPVVIEGKQSGAGQLPGAIIGGVAGSSVGEGKGQQIFTILGAVGGAVVGSMIEEQATRTQGLELTIKMDSGKTLSIVQEVDHVNVFREGQRVRVLTQGALARVSPE